jgi:putative peptidoglycan lipid II flippase
MELMFSFKLFYKLKRILKLSFTIVLSQLSAFIVLIYPNYMASGMEIGTLTAVGYARRLFDIMPGLLIYPVSLVLTPRFTEMARQDYSYMGKEARRAIDLLSFVLLPISIFIALFAPDITRLLFERGSYSEHHIIITAESMRYFLVSLVVIGSNSIITRALMATQDLKIAYLSLLFAIIPAIGIPAFTYSACFLWGYLGISIGYSFYMILVHQSLGYVMFYCMIEKYRLSEVITSYVLILVFSFLAIYFAYYSTKIFNVHIVFKLIFAFAISSLIYLLLHYIFKTDLLHLMVQEVRIVSGRYAKNSR